MNLVKNLNKNSDEICHKYICWGAITAGVILGLSVEAILNLFGLGTNLTFFSLDYEVLSFLSIGSYIWLIISGIVAMFSAGWIAGLTSNVNTNFYVWVQGILVWAISVLISFFLVAISTGGIIGGMASILNESMHEAAYSVRLSDENSSENFIEKNSYSPSDIISNPEKFNDIDLSKNEWRNFIFCEENMYDPNAAECNSKISSEQINDIKNKIEEPAQKATRVLGMIAFITCLSFLLSAIACIVGSSLGMKYQLKINKGK